MSGARRPFSGPAGIAVDQHGDLYVADSGNNRIEKFDSEGKFILKWDGVGSGDGRFNCSMFAIAVDGKRYLARSLYRLLEHGPPIAT
jgi:DNA-binding beta-propeller fold protein YncE